MPLQYRGEFESTLHMAIVLHGFVAAKPLQQHCRGGSHDDGQKHRGMLAEAKACNLVFHCFFRSPASLRSSQELRPSSTSTRSSRNLKLNVGLTAVSCLREDCDTSSQPCLPSHLKLRNTESSVRSAIKDPSRRSNAATVISLLAIFLAAAPLLYPPAAMAIPSGSEFLSRAQDMPRALLTWLGDFLAGHRASLIAATDPWGVWAVLLGAAAGGFWSERTALGRALSGPLVSTLLCLAASALRVLPASSPAYSAVSRFLLPLAVPLLLLGADLSRVVRDTGRLLLAFAVGAAGTTFGTFVASYFVPLTSLGADGWKIAAALMSRHIGGAVNYVAVTDALAASPSVVAAALAADNLLCAVYFASLFALAADIGPEGGATEGGQEGSPAPALNLLDATSAVALSAVLCWGGSSLASALRFAGGTIPCVTALVLLLATAAPRAVAPLVPVGDAVAAVLLQIFFASVGATGSVASVFQSAPSLFLFILLQLVGHVAFTLLVGRLLGLQRRDLLIASNANVGGPTTAAGMATARGWRSLRVPAILIGVFGYAIATFLSIFVGSSFLRNMHRPTLW